MTEFAAFTTNATISKATADLIYAVQHNMPRNTRVALRRGGDVHVKDDQGNSLLHICPNARIGAILIEAGADVNARNSAGQTPLHASMRRGTINLTKLLIIDHTDINAQETNGSTALHLAESAAVNKLLLDDGANPNLQNTAGDTPLHLAIRLKGVPIISELIARGADKAITNKAGDNAFNELQKLIQRTEKELVNIARTVIGDPTVSANAGTCDMEDATRTMSTNPTPNKAQSGEFNLASFNRARHTGSVASKQADTAPTYKINRPRP